MWQKNVKQHLEANDLVVIGVVQEQHPHRARLYQQWRQLNWPIVIDSLNVLSLQVVPVVVALDENGIVRHNGIRPKQFSSKFMEVRYPKVEVPGGYNRAQSPDLQDLAARAAQSNSAADYRALGDENFLAGKLKQAIAAYREALKRDPADGSAHFRLGVALRRRAESPARKPGDAQAAVEHWGSALALNPNQYIWRRRLQQYGPRPDKPYDFYSWVHQARDEIRDRGAVPVDLAVEPYGSEVAPPAHLQATVLPPRMENRDPERRINRDTKRLVDVDCTVTPAAVRPGHRVRVRTTFRLNDAHGPYWNNEGGTLSTWVELSPSLKLVEGQLTYPRPTRPETRELRVLEFELAVDRQVQPAVVALPAYALYTVCESKGGKCLLLRQDFEVRLTIDPQAATLH